MGNNCVLITVIVAILTLVATVVGVVVAIRAGVADDEDRNAKRPKIYPCIQDFSYEGIPTTSGELQIQLSAQVRLVNTGKDATTVTAISFNPVGTWRNGEHGGILLYEDPHVYKRVEGHGAELVSIDKYRDSSVRKPEFWVDNAEYVNVQAKTADSFIHPMLQCIQSFSSWECGDMDLDTGSLSVASACF